MRLLAVDDDFAHEFKIAHVAGALWFLHFSVVVAAVAVHAVQFDHFLFFDQTHVFAEDVDGDLEALFQALDHLFVRFSWLWKCSYIFERFIYSMSTN